jgi:hypothetical protein
MTVFYRLTHTRRRHTNAILVVLDFLWNTYQHNFQPAQKIKRKGNGALWLRLVPAKLNYYASPAGLARKDHIDSGVSK